MNFGTFRLIKRESGIELDSNLLVKDANISNGSILVLIQQELIFMAYCAITSSSGSSSYYAGVIQELKNKKSNYVKLQKDLVDIDGKLGLVYNTYFFSAMDNLT